MILALAVQEGGAKGSMDIDLNHPLNPATPRSLRLKIDDVSSGRLGIANHGTVETAYNWKKTIGPLEQREEVWGPWNYRRTHGMGFYEYLQFCQDINAEPLYVGFAGETCMFRSVEDVPMEQMDRVAADFGDALEFANNDASSTWGRKRAEQGHPDPLPTVRTMKLSD